MKFTPTSTSSEHPVVTEIKKTLEQLFPKLTPEDLKPILESVIKDIGKKMNDKPALETNIKDLKLEIEASINTHVFEKEFEKTIKQYTQNLEPAEQKKLKENVKEEMDKLQKKGMDLKKNPKAFEIMMKLLVLKHCLHPDPKLSLKHKLKVDPTIEMKNNVSKLKMEYMKLLKELEKTDPTLVLQLKEVMKKVFLEMDKKIESQKEPTEEITKLFKTLVALSDLPKDKEFDKLPPEDKVTIITQGSKEGKYASIPRNDVNMPTDIIVFPNTPAANEIKAPETPFDISKGPKMKE